MPSEILFDDCGMMCVKARDSVLKKKKKVSWDQETHLRGHVQIQKEKNNKRLSGIHDLMSI